MTRPPARIAPRTVVLTVAVLTAIMAGLAGLAFLGSQTMPERAGPPIEELAVERTVLAPGIIELGLRNAGPDPVVVAQIFVNDVYADFTGARAPLDRLGSATVRISYPWQDGQPYLVSMLTSTGLVIEHEIPAAVVTPRSDGKFLGTMALLGTYVGIIPVMLGMLVLPVLRASGDRLVRGVLAITVGLLAFLAVDAALEGLDLLGGSAGPFGGTELLLLGAGLAFLVLTGVDHGLRRRGERASGVRLALMIAIGIGLHNLGEGLAIGSAYAIGELALGASLVIGFALHNTTEGLAIVAPLTRLRPSLPTLAGLGLIAGGPAIIGAAVGATVNNAELSALLIGVGVGAIAQVIVQLAPSLRAPTAQRLDATALGGVAVGLVVMYVTGMLVTA